MTHERAKHVPHTQEWPPFACRYLCPDATKSTCNSDKTRTKQRDKFTVFALVQLTDLS